VKEVAHGDSLLAQLRDLTAEAQRLKATAERAGDYRAALAAVRELCRIVELMAKLSGELDSHSETKILNVTLGVCRSRGWHMPQHMQKELQQTTKLPEIYSLFFLILPVLGDGHPSNI
jgi:hypothetical protein